MARSLTPAPRATISPAPSSPGRSDTPGGGAYSPARCNASGRFTPAHARRMSTCPACGSGTGRVVARSTSGPPASAISTAVIVSVMSCLSSVRCAPPARHPGLLPVGGGLDAAQHRQRPGHEPGDEPVFPCPCLDLLDLHDVVDAAVEKVPCARLPLALVAQPVEHGRAVDTRERGALGIPVDILRGVAKRRPDMVGGAPHGAGAVTGVLGQGKERH